MTQKCPYCGMNPLGTKGSLLADCCEYGDYLFNQKIDKTIVDEAFKKQEHLYHLIKTVRHWEEELAQWRAELEEAQNANSKV